MTEHQLPEGFSELEPWVDDWALATRAQRYAARLDRPYDDLVAFYDAIAPHAERAIALPRRSRHQQPGSRGDQADAHAVLDDPGVVRGEHLQAEPHTGLRRRILRDGRRTRPVSTLPLSGSAGGRRRDAGGGSAGGYRARRVRRRRHQGGAARRGGSVAHVGRPARRHRVGLEEREPQQAMRHARPAHRRGSHLLHGLLASAMCS